MDDTTTREAVAWTDRIIVGATLGTASPPAWMRAAYEEFHRIVAHPDYPCYFGTQAESRGALYYSFAPRGEPAHLPRTLRTFLQACPRIQRDRNNLVLFLEPAAEPPSHDADRAQFWNVLRYLQAHDPGPARSPALDPSDPRWEFTFAGREFFVVGTSPAYRLHRSRNLGPGMLMLFQPREVFGAEGSPRTRRLIRERAQRWDGVPAHPDLGTYGEPGNREWAQYFISDDNSPAVGRCPLLHGAAAARRETSARPENACDEH